MYSLQQSTAISVPFFAYDTNGDAVTGKVTGDWTKRIKKAGGAFAAMTVTVTELEGGWYDLVMDTGHTDTLGLLTVYLTATGVKQVNMQWPVTVAGEAGANLTHIGGNANAAATLNLTKLNIVNSGGDAVVMSSTGSNGHGLALSGNGTGEGLRSTGGATGHGAEFTGGATSGDGLVGTGGASGYGLRGSGTGTFAGLFCTATSAGVGADFLGGTASGSGLRVQSQASFTPAFACEAAGSNAAGMYVAGGSNGNGLHVLGAGSGHGLRAESGGSGDGINAEGGLTGNGIEAVGGATSGNGMYMRSVGNNTTGVVAEGQGNGAGLFATSLSGYGFQASSSTGTAFAATGATGGVLASASNGSAVAATSTGGNGHGMAVSGNGTGEGLRSTGGATGHGAEFTGGSTSGDGIKATVTSGAAFGDALVDSILDRAVSEPAGVFTWPASLRSITAFMGVLSRNKITQTATTQLVRNDADSATLATSTQSDDGTTFVRGELT